MSDPVHAVFVTADGESCAEAVEALEAAGDDDLRVGGATSVEAIRGALEEAPVDAVVFGEDKDPLSPDGVQLLDVVDLCTAPPGEAGRSTVPLLLFSDGTYPLSTAKATDGVTDYVRAGSDDAFEHLADRLRWLSSDAGDDTAYYKQIVEEMEDGVLTFDDEGRIRYANGAMAEAFGLRQDAFEGTDPTELAEWGLVSQEGVEGLVSAVEAIVDGGVDVRRREMTITPSVEDVERRVVEFQIVGMPGEASGAIATVRGVTEYKRMENALRTTSTKVERLPEGIRAIRSADTESDLFETTATVVSKFVSADVCGVDAVENGQFVPLATVGADYGPSSATEGVDARAVRDGETVLVEAPTGEDAPVENAGSQLCLPVEGLGLIRALAGGQISNRDRGLAETLSKHAAETLARIQAETRASEYRDRLTSLYRSVPHPVASVALDDGEPTVLAVNAGFERTFGVGNDDAAGEPLRDHVRPTDDDPGAERPDLVTALQSDGPAEIECRRETTDGPRTFGVHVGPSSAASEDGSLVYVDVTDDDSRDPTADSPTREPVDIEPVASRAWNRVGDDDVAFTVEGGSVAADADDLSTLFERLFRDVGSVGDNGNASSVAVQVGPLTESPGFFVEDATTEIPPALQGEGTGNGTDPSGDAESGVAAVRRTARERGWSVRVSEGESGGTRFEFVAE